MRLIFIVIVLLLQGCVVKIGDQTPKVVTSVNSLALPNIQSMRSYLLIPSTPNVSQNDLQFREYANYVNRLLELKGYTLAIDEQPDIVIFLGYGVGEPEESVNTYQMPIIGTSPSGISSINGTLTQNSINTRVDATVVEQRNLAITGYTTHTNKTVSFSRHLELYAVDFSTYLSSRELIPVWQTTVTSRGSNADLRYIFPYLVAASNKFIANDSGSIIEITVRQDNLLKKYIEGLESVPPPF